MFAAIDKAELQPGEAAAGESTDYKCGAPEGSGYPRALI